MLAALEGSDRVLWHHDAGHMVKYSNPRSGDRVEEYLTQIQGKHCRYERPCLLAPLPTSLLYDLISGDLIGIDGMGQSLRLDVSLGLADNLDELATGSSATPVMSVREGRQKGWLRVTYNVLNLGHFGFGTVCVLRN